MTFPFRRLLLLFVGLAGRPPLFAAGPDRGVEFDIPRQPAVDAVRAFAQQSGVPLVYAAADLEGVTTNAVRGRATPDEAIDRLCRGTPLAAVHGEDGSIGLKRKADDPKAEREAVPATNGRPSARAQSDDERVVLSPFEVQADSDRSYGTLNSRSITAFNTALDHLPISADIFDQAFMKDVGALSVEDMIGNYSAGAGSSALSAGATAGQNQPGDRVNLRYTQLRGLQTPNLQRNSLLFVGTLGGPGGTSIGQTSNFDLERVEVIFGPEALLYDGGGAGGVINLVTKEARLGAPAAGSLSFRTDQWGSKYGLLDYGVSDGPLAARVAMVNASNQSRRVNLGDELDGIYVQFAAALGTTTLRLSLEQTRDARNAPAYLTLTTTGDAALTPAGPAYSAYNGYSPGDLLSSGKAAAFANGHLNWSNLNSYDGYLSGDDTVAEFATVEANTRWSDWLSTQLSAGLSGFSDDHFMDVGAITLYSPGATANPAPGNWTMGMTGAFSASDGVRPYHGQGLRGSALLTKDLFGGGAHSQTVVGADLLDNRGGIIEYAYYQADSNWNILANGPAATNLGRLVLPKLNWTVNNGPRLYPSFRLGAPRVTVNGVNYVRAMENPFDKSLVSPANPLGAGLVGGPNGLRNDAINSGVYATNYTQWDRQKLDTLLGVRLEHAYAYTARPEKNPASLTPVEIIDSHNLNFNAGLDYHFRPSLTGYVSVSDSYLVPPDLQNDPNGQPLPVSHALGGEAGLKFGDPSGKVSGSLAFYHSQAKNEEFLMSAALENDINPSGLNGNYDSDSTNAYAANAEASGVQLMFTATSADHWRLRFSAAYADGKIESNRTYGEIYNDQFHENASGQVTYADGTVVYVAPAFNSKTPAYTSATAPAGSEPLTATLLGTPGGLYFANPVAATGGVLTSSTAAKVLQSADPTHGAILTGATGLPMTAYQLNPALTGVPITPTIPVATAGDKTTGYPEFSFNVTGVYTVGSGALKGLEFGGSVVAGGKIRSFYYYPNGLTSGAASRALFSLPTNVQVNPLIGYTRKLRRVSFTSQLNLFNVFNRYQVIVFPDLVNGWSSPASLTANLDGQPRSYAWTNTIGF